VRLVSIVLGDSRSCRSRQGTSAVRYPSVPEGFMSIRQRVDSIDGELCVRPIARLPPVHDARKYDSTSPRGRLCPLVVG